MGATERDLKRLTKQKKADQSYWLRCGYIPRESDVPPHPPNGVNIDNRPLTCCCATCHCNKHR